MITGEHAVVYGHRAIVAAIDQRITVELSVRRDGKLRIFSEIAADYVSDLDNVVPSHDHSFVLAAVMKHRDALDTGIDLSITSEIDPTLGLGSSAAVTIACLGVLSALTGSSGDRIHADAVEIVRSIQKRGSGADLAASLHGGMIAYKAPPGTEITALPIPPALGLKYVGYKTPTSEVLRQVAERMATDKEKFENLYSEMGAAAEAAIVAASHMDWKAFGTNLNSYQTLMEKLGVSDNNLQAIVEDARTDARVLAAKISGSGLGDCVLAFGAVPSGFARANVASEGLVIDV